METVGQILTEEWCGRCGKTHPLNEFYPNREEKNRAGSYAYCMESNRRMAFLSMRKLRHPNEPGLWLAELEALQPKPRFEVQAYHPMQQDILAEVAAKTLGLSNKQVNVKRGLFYLGELLDEPGVYTLGETRNLRTRYSGHQRDRIRRDFRYIRVDGVDGFYDLDRKRIEGIGLRLFAKQFERLWGSDGVITDWYRIPTREQAIAAFKKICLEQSTKGTYANQDQPVSDSEGADDSEADWEPEYDFIDEADDFEDGEW